MISWDTPPLTTAETLIARSEQTGHLVILMRASAWREWADLDAATREETAIRLQEMRWRHNDDDQLRHRHVSLEEPIVRTVTETAAPRIATVLAALAGAVRRIGGRRA